MKSSEPHDLRPGDVHQKFCVLAGRKVLLDKEGFLWHVDDWTEEIAEVLASECGIETLNASQWRVIRFLREFFAYHGRSPLNRDLKAGLGMNLMELEALFPGGIRHGARRVAGLPNPRSCTG
jgi:dissimilatory sulfite reductase related protein